MAKLKDISLQCAVMGNLHSDHISKIWDLISDVLPADYTLSLSADPHIEKNSEDGQLVIRPDWVFTVSGPSQIHKCELKN